MEIRKKIILTPNEAKEMQEFLDGPGDGGSNTVATYTAKFRDGIEVDIKVCDGDTPFIDPVIFQNGQEIYCTEPDDTLLGEYKFEVDENTFIVKVEVKDDSK